MLHLNLIRNTLRVISNGQRFSINCFDVSPPSKRSNVVGCQGVLGVILKTYGSSSWVTEGNQFEEGVGLTSKRGGGNFLENIGISSALWKALGNCLWTLPRHLSLRELWDKFLLMSFKSKLISPLVSFFLAFVVISSCDRFLQNPSN